MKCLVAEDYGTTGLDGPTNPDAGYGNFYNFWWREGMSQKIGQRAGRWGLGKTTFHIVSKLKTFWGMTVRDDGKSLLMGKALLKAHSLNDRRYHYFGYFSGNDFMPVEDTSMLSVFKDTFGISRDDNKTGLSVAIPVPVDEITFESVVKGVIHNYYYPILAGTLRVEIKDSINGRQEELNSYNFVEKASGIQWSDTEWEGIDVRKILQFIKDSLNIPPDRLNIQESENPCITQESFEGQLQTIKKNFLMGLPLRFELPVTIRKTDRTEQEASLMVLLKRFSEFRKPFEAYIRSGILISDIRMLGNRSVAGLLIANDPPVCEFLGDCETPAHTNWNERTEGFPEKYINATRILRFIRKSLTQIISILDEPPSERQIDFLREIFSIPVSPEEREEGEEITEPPGIPPVTTTPAQFNINRIQGGFTVTLNRQSVDLSFPFEVTVKMAYDTRRGNPFAEYHENDFNVGRAPIKINCADCNVIERKGNKLKIQITGRDFELRVTEFDPKRDLVIDIK